jgi:hypothetical protein
VCGEPAHDVGAVIPNEADKILLGLPPSEFAVFFYMVCRDCITSRAEEVMEAGTKVAMSTKVELNPERN